MDVKRNELYWAKVKPSAIIPTREKENAGYDFYPCFEESFLLIAPNETKFVPTGVACAMSESYYLQIEERGSTGSKGIKKSAGVVDSGFRGEIFIAITNCSNQYLCIAKKEDVDHVMTFFDTFPDYQFLIYPYEKAIAQGVIHRVHEMEEKEITYAELCAIPSKRGTGSLGSTGK